MPFDNTPHLSRRSLVTGLAVAAVTAPAFSIAGAAPAQASPWPSHPVKTETGTLPAATVLVPPYEQKTFTFGEVALTGGIDEYSVWERRATETSPWHPVDATGLTYTFTPRWRDIGASFRVRTSEGQTLAVYTLGKPTLVGIDPCTDPRVSPQAVGDGVTDDARALTAAARVALALNTGLDLKGRTYAIGDNVLIRNKCTAVFNGTLRQLRIVTATGTIKTGSLMFAGKKLGLPENVKGCVVSDVTLEMIPDKGYVGIIGNSASHVAIVDCTFPNPLSHGTPISLWNYKAGGENVEEITVRGNAITLADALGKSSAAAVYVDTAVDYKDTPNITEYWKKYRKVPDFWYTTEEVYVGANTIHGGYYSVSLVSVGKALVEANTSTMNIRNISMQQGVHHSTVRDNDLSDSASSGIHLAFCSSDNLIENNSITTGRMDPEWGEGLLQAYIGTNRNRFIGNRVTTTSPRGCRWFIYSGVQVNGNEFISNTLSGPCVRAYICLEAAWDPTCTHFVHRGNTQPPLPLTIFDNYTGGDSVGNVIKFNLIDRPAVVPPDPYGRPLAEGICLADITDNAGTWRLIDTEYTPNRYVGSNKPIKPHIYLG